MVGAALVAVRERYELAGRTGPQGELRVAALALQQHLPEPTEQPLTRMPFQVAATTLPALCTMIRLSRAVRPPMRAFRTLILWCGRAPRHSFGRPRRQP